MHTPEPPLAAPLRAHLDLSPEGALILRIPGPPGGAGFQCVHVNAAAERLLGCKAEAVRGQPVQQALPELAGPELVGLLERMAAGPGSAQAELFSRAGGADRWLRAVATSDGETVLLLLTDVTEWKGLQYALAQETARAVALAEENTRLRQDARRDRQEAEQAQRTKDELLATVSHELRTPLTAILGWIRILRAGGLNVERREQALATIERNARWQAALVDELLDLSEIITGELTLTLAPLHPLGIVEAAVDAFRPAAEQKGVRLVSNLDARAGPLNADGTRLKQIVSNLLSNALKFTPAGGQVEVRLRAAHGRALLEVCDTGVGIAPSLMPHLFEHLHPSKAHGRSGGALGLGLPMTRQLVRLHGGEVSAQSEGPGQGARFTVSLPLIAHPRLPIVEVPREHRLDGVHVLLLDDSEDVRDVVSALLEQAGAEVTGVATPAQALEALARLKPHILISDVGMPEEDGYSFIQRVRAGAADGASTIPAVALTGHVRHEDRARALHAGFQGHVTKPVDPTELITLIATLTAPGASPLPLRSPGVRPSGERGQRQNDLVPRG